MTFEIIYFGYSGDGVAATKWYLGVPPWWPLPIVPTKVRVEEMRVGYKGFAVP
jgi:hypothetical protein